METDLHLRDIGNVLRRRKGLVAGTALLGATLAGIVGFLLPPQYAVKAQILYDPHQTDTIGTQAAFIVDQPSDESAIQTVVASLTSTALIERVIESLPEDESFRKAVTKAHTRAATLRDGVWRSLDHLWQWGIALFPAPWQEALFSSKAMAPPSDLKVAAPSPLDAAIDALRQHKLERHLNVYQEHGSKVIAVRFTSTSPDEAVAVANAISRLYVGEQKKRKLDLSSGALAWLDKRLPLLRDAVTRSDAAIHAYQSLHSHADTYRTSVIDQQLSDLNHQLTDAQADVDRRRAQLDYFRGGAHKRADPATAALISPVMSDLSHQEAALLEKEAQLKATLGSNHPRLQEVHGQLQQIRAALAEERAQTVSGLESDMQIANARVAALRQRISAVQGDSADEHVGELKREADSARALYESTVRRRDQIHEQQQNATPDVTILSAATAPDHPSSPSAIFFFFPALILFAGCGSFLAVLLESADQKLRSGKDVNDVLGLPCIGFVPAVGRLGRLGRARRHQYLLRRPFTPYTESIRSIVAALQLSHAHESGKVVLMTSSVPGEGKTTVAVSFAVYAALLGRRVLLVDLDLRHPSITRELGGRNKKGLLDFLANDEPSEEIIRRHPKLPLDYLPVARRPSDPLAVIASERMERRLSELRQKYDCIVIDGPPLLMMTETRFIASMADKVVFIVRWGSTRRDVARNALGLLRNVGLGPKEHVDVAGAVMTQVNLRQHAKYRYGDTAELIVRYRSYYPSTIGELTSTLFGAHTKQITGPATRHQPEGGQ